MLGFAGLAVGHHLRRAHNAVLRLKIGQALLVAVDASLQVGELRAEPAGGLRGGLNLRFGFLLAVGAMSALTTAAESAASCERKRISTSIVRGMVCTCRRREKRSRSQACASGVGCVGIESRKAAGKVAAEAGSLVELEADDHAPGQLIAAQDAGQRFKSDGRGKNGGSREGFIAPPG